MPKPENIIPPKKGEVRNPNGKPKGTKNRSTLLKKWLEVNAKITNPETKEVEVGTVEDRVVLALIKKAISGDVAAAKEILDTMYGKIKENNETQQNYKIVVQSDNEEIKKLLQEDNEK